MARLSDEEYEGRLNAHRELLTSLLSTLAAMDPRLLSSLEEETAVLDGEEDPGVMPSAAFAAANAMSEETRSILRAAAERASSRARP